MEMETSQGLQPPSKTFCLSQTPEFLTSCSSINAQILENDPPLDPGNTTIAPVRSSTNILALPPAPNQGQTENGNLCEIKTNLSKPLDAYQIPVESQDPLLFPLEIPDTHQLLTCINPLGQEGSLILKMLI